MADSADPAEARKFVVTEVVKTDPPRGLSGGSWYRYTIGHGSSPITGVRSGSLNSVTRYADEFAENLNERALHGYSVYATRRTVKK